MITISDVKDWMIRLSGIFKENKEYLTELDSAIGDADHGINLDRGFAAVKKDLESREYTSVKTLLKSEAMVLIKTVGGASGPLLGTCFLQMSRSDVPENNLDGNDLAEIFKAGLEGIKTRGHAVEGEKTMIDTWSPAVKAMEASAAKGSPIEEILSEGARAAEKGMNSTIDMTAKKGRASYLGERSIGHLDPGAASSFMMIKAASELWK